VQVCQPWYSCWKHNWKIFAGRSSTASLVAVTLSSASWNWRPHSFSFKHGRKRNHMVRNQLSVPLEQAQSDVQGHCRGVIASTSCAKAQDTYKELSCVDGEASLCSSACLQSLLGWILCEHLQMSWKTIQALPCILTWFLLSLATVAISR
jgi:hypothetical protein